MNGAYTSPSTYNTATHHHSTAASGGLYNKRVKPPPLYVPAGHVVLRLLCHVSRIGGLIGKSGFIIKNLQAETSSRIRIEDPGPDPEDHRVVVVVASATISRAIRLNGGDETVEVSAAQEGMLRVFERVVEVAAEEVGFSELAAGGVTSCRLLAEKSHAGGVIGRGGRVVEQIKRDTGCRIRVLSSERLPACALPTDQIVEIEGDILDVKKALVAVCRCLQDCSPVDKSNILGGRSQDLIPQEFYSMRMNLPPVMSLETNRAVTLDTRKPHYEETFRILCSCDIVGSVIGKGGTTVKALENESGAFINVSPTTPDCDERLITVTAKENSESRHSLAQDAVVRVFSKMAEAMIDSDSDGTSTFVILRIAVPKNQVGCLLGKGGSIIAETRKLTGTSIHIFGGDHVPKCVSENYEVVQISGEFSNVKDALYKVTCRLRDNLLPRMMLNGFGETKSSHLMSQNSSYDRGRVPPSLGYHPFVEVSHNLNQHTSLTQSMNKLGISHNTEGPRLGSWGSQAVPGVTQSEANECGTELDCARRSAIVASTTLEIIVPENVISFVYGENGSNLIRLREISGAKVVVHEPRRGTTDRVVMISGTPDQTNAAQTVLQAFIQLDSR